MRRFKFSFVLSLALVAFLVGGATCGKSRNVGSSRNNNNKAKTTLSTSSFNKENRIKKVRGSTHGGKGPAQAQLNIYSDRSGTGLVSPTRRTNAMLTGVRDLNRGTDFSKRTSASSNPISMTDRNKPKTGFRMDNQNAATGRTNTQAQINGVSRNGGASTSVTKVDLPMQVRETNPTFVNRAHDHSARHGAVVSGEFGPRSPNSSPRDYWSPSSPDRSPRYGAGPSSGGDPYGRYYDASRRL